MHTIRCYILPALCLSLLFSCSSSGYKEKEGFAMIDSLLCLRKDAIYSQPDSVIRFLTLWQQQVADSAEWYYGESHKGICYLYNNQVDSAVACYDDVDAFLIRNPPSAQMWNLAATNYNYRGMLLQMKNDRDSALVCFTNAYDAVSKASYRKEMCDICINAADVCRQLGKLPQASDWYRKALVAADSLNLSLVKHSVYMGMGLIYADLKNYSLAQHYFSIADSLYPPYTPYEEYTYYNSRGNCYYFEQKYPEALTCFRKAYAVTKPFKQRSAEATIEANLGEVHLMSGQLDSAHFYLDRAYEYFGQQAAADDGIRFYIHGLYASLALEENDLNAAGFYLMKPYDAVRIGPSYLYLYHKRLMEYYKRRGDYQRAFDYQEMVATYDDSLRNTTHLNSLAEIEYRYRQDTTLLKRDIIIANTHNKVSRLQNAVIISVVLLALFVVSVLLVYWYIRRRHEQQRRKQVELVTRLRMENVRNRFSPHFVFNVLNVVVSSLRQYEEETLPLKLLVQVLRSNLLMCGKIAISLEEEVGIVRNYVALRSSMNRERMPVQWDIAPDVDMNALLPSMIIQIPVENAMKHAFPPGHEVGCPIIAVTVRNESDASFRVVIEDNGVGYIPGGEQMGTPGVNDTGNGIRILYRTVELLNSLNARKIRFTIDDRSLLCPDGQGTRVTVLVPYHYNYEV